MTSIAGFKMEALSSVRLNSRNGTAGAGIRWTAIVPTEDFPMPHLVTALFENAGQAQRALQALMETGVAASRISAAGIPEGRTVSSISGFRTLSAGEDAIRELRELSLPEEDLHAFARALQRGRTLVAVQASGQDRDETIRVLEMFEPIELEDGDNAERSAVDPGPRSAWG